MDQGEEIMVGLDKRDQLAIFLGILLFTLLSYPLLEIFNRDILVAGIPLLPFYSCVCQVLQIGQGIQVLSFPPPLS